MIRAVLFDIDGTLLDTELYIASAIKNNVEVFRLKEKSDTELKQILGFGMALPDLYTKIGEGNDVETMRLAHIAFQLEHPELTSVFPNVTQVLKTLQRSNFLLGAITNRSKHTVLNNLEHHGLRNYFDSIICFEDVEKPKPDAEPILKTLEKFALQPNQVIMVGDTEADIKAGKAAQVKTVGVTYGMMGKTIENIKPDYVIDNLMELVKILRLKTN